MKKKFFAMLMAVVLCVGMLPTGVLADSEQSTPEEFADAEVAVEDESFGGIQSLAVLPTSNKQTVRWTYGNNVYTEFYVAAYDKSTEKELSFDIDYSVTETASNVTIDLTELTESVSHISDGTNAYTYSYATVYGIDYEDEKNKSDESYWQTLGSADQPVTKLVLTYGNSVSGSRLWGYSAYSGDDELGHIDVLAHNDSQHPYIYLQLWCSQGDELPDIAENIDSGVVYKQLDTAISDASAGDTIQLLGDLDVEAKKTDQYTIDKNLTLDLNENTITVDCNNDSYRLFNVASGVEATIENGTIDGGVDTNASGNAIYGTGTSSALADVILEDLTIENFGASSNYGTVYVYDGSLTATNCTFLNNGNSAITMRSSAGDANLYDGTALTLEGCEISGNTNSTNNYGGGVGVRQISEVSISDCTVTGNAFESTPSGIYGGGGIILYNVGEITLNKNIITNNTSSEYGGGILLLSGAAFGLGDKTTISDNTITGNTASLNGGGLSYYINTEMHAGEAYCTFVGNAIDENYSYTRGGGMSMYSSDPGFTFTLLSGTVNNNKAFDSGGGIDFAWERPATLQLYNTLITENIAAKGGGVWLCPTSETIMHVTFGGAIYHNEASASPSCEESCGDEIRFEGDSYGDGYGGMMVNIASRALGGMLMDWYTDEYGARCKEGLGTLIDVTSPEYTDRTEECSIHGDLSERGIVLAEEEAATIISNNEAEQGYGGGIASNAVIEFGEEDTAVTVVKEWKDENGDALEEDLPDSIDVTLVRVSGDGEEAERADLETVTLRAENDWSWTFTELPSNYTYEVREETKIPGYETSYETTTDEDGITHIVITNTLEVVNISGVKIWNDEDNQDGKRPGNITIYLKADGEYVTDENGDPITATIYYQGERTAISPVAEPLFKLMSADLSQWNWEFVDANGSPIVLPKYDESDGHEIEYTIEEVGVSDYETEIVGDPESGYTITNTHIPETIDLSGIKIWDDGDNQDGIRPAYVTLFLYTADGQVMDEFGEPVSVTVAAGADGNWNWSFAGLPKYSNGEEIHYSVKEAYDSDGYTASYGLDDKGDIIVTNSHEPATVDISFTKRWDDNNNRDNEEPYSITVRLRKAGQAEEVAHITLTAEDNWSYTWFGLPKYEDGEEIWYYVTEDAIEGYTPSYNPESSMKNGYTITNTHTPDLTSLAVSKVWLDEEDQDGMRPESITVMLLADGNPALDENGDTVTLELSADNNWFGTFSGLPVYQEGAVGEKIAYTVQENELPDGYTKVIEGDAETGYVITNSHTPEEVPGAEQLSISKEVSGDGDTSEFAFQIALTVDGAAYSGDVTATREGGVAETVSFEDGTATVFIQAGETLTLDVPDGADWKVIEITNDADSVLIYVNGEVVEKPADKSEAYAAVGTIWDTTEVEFLNSYRAYFPIDEEIVADEDDIFNRDAWVKDESVNEYNAIEIEMTTTLPVITAYDIENGKFTMTFHEVLDHELVLDEETADFSVYIAEQLISKAYYRIVFDEETGDGCSFHVDVDLTALYHDGVITEDDLQGDTEITIFFFADLEGTNLNGSYKSTIWYDVSDAGEILYTSNVDVVEVYTYEIEIFKYNTETGEGLEGATLGVYYDEECTEPVYRYVGRGFDETEKQAYTVTSGEDGYAMFYGLAEGTYYVKETEAPDGYVLSEKVLAVELSAALNASDHIYRGEYANTPEEVPEPEPEPEPEPVPVPDNDNPPDSDNTPDSGNPTDNNNQPDNSNPGTITGTTGGTGGSGGTNSTGNPGGTSGAGGTGGTSSTGTTKTGDAGNAGLWLVLLILAGACVVGSVTVRTRKTRQRRR